MPIEYWIDHKCRLVRTRGHGTLSEEDFFTYQREVWSKSEVTGYDELVDMTDVNELVHPSVERIKELATLAAAMDSPAPKSKFAMVAPTALVYGLGRMYEAFRSEDPRSNREVGVFRTRDEAMLFLAGGAPEAEPV